MDPPKYEGSPCPFQHAGWLSKLLFLWPKPLINKGWRRPLTNKDLFHMLPEDTPQHNVNILQREWDKELLKSKYGNPPNFWFAICRSVGALYLKVGIICLVEVICRLSQPVLFSYLMTYFAAGGQGISHAHAWWCVVGIIFFCLVHIVTGPHIVHQFIRITTKFQGAANSLIYRKAMRLSYASLRGYSRGQIIDYITNDASRPAGVVWFLHTFWIGPLCAIFSLYVMYSYIGIVAFLGMAVGLISAPVTGYLGKKVAEYRKQQCEMTDKRVGVITELVSAMRLVKMYCWEKPFGRKVDAIRREELKLTWLHNLWVSLLMQFSYSVSRLILISMIIFYSLSGHTMNATTMFPVLTYFTILQENFFISLTWGFKEWKEVKVSLKRIQDFLQAEELSQVPDDVYNQRKGQIEDKDVVVSFKNVSAKWNKSSPHLTLADVSFSHRQGELVTIIGPIGSGKSSLLMAILGELPVSGGHVTTSGQLSYAAQQPWVFSSSLRQNILMGQEWESERYTNILKATALDKDLECFAHGDLTLVGDRGVTLSGGQKARINLARALYRHADVYLLDDPLSAVDTNVGQHIFNRCVKGLLKDKLCILVTHQLQYLQDSNEIIIVNEGRIDAQGTYEELLSSGVDFVKFLSEQGSHKLKKTDVVKTSRQESLGEEFLQNVQDSGPDWEEEDREKGRVKFAVFLKFFKYGGGVIASTSLILLFVAAQLSYNLSDWWISQWSSLENVHSISETVDISQTKAGYSLSWKLGVYLLISAAVIGLGTTRIVSYYWVCLRAGRILHDKMFSSVMRCPIRFFDKTPTGRLINRFASAVDRIDHDLPQTSQEFFLNLTMVLGSVIMIVIYTPLVLVPTIPLVAVLIYTHRQFVNTQRELQRIESLRRSPYVNHVNSTLEGLETLRALKLQDRCIHDFDQQVELMLSSSFTDNCVYGWLHTRMKAVVSLFIISAVLGCMMAAESLTSGDVGLVMVNAVPLMWFLGELTRHSGDTETSFIQAERVVAYTNLPSEAPLETTFRVDSNWPQDGAIDFVDVSFKHSDDLPVILHHITFSIKPREKIGIVGRTGAGKSSLVQAMFRLSEPQGQILIDGMDIGKLGLHDLRSKISIIPQDPVMFGGTLRQNLDPFDQYSDNSLWQCLEEVHLKEMVWKLADGLESVVLEGGSNFSLGERQLFCLARAILKETKILVLDEATANVDLRTDQWIQESIRNRFQHCTVLTIAHRLNTVMNADRVMVLEKGHLREFDKVSVLLKNTQGFLYKLVEKTGPTEQQRLMQLANERY